MDYGEIYEWIADCLQDSMPRYGPGPMEGQLYFYGFDKDIKSTIRDFIPASALASAGLTDSGAFYDALTGDDRDRVTEAVALIVSAKTIGPLSTGGANGQLLSEKTEQVSRTFANEPGNKADWLARAGRLLASCSFAPPSGLRGGSLFAANGPSRVRDERRDDARDCRGGGLR